MFCDNRNCKDWSYERVSGCKVLDNTLVSGCKDFKQDYRDQKILDPVDHPDHYQTSKIECIDAIEAAIEGLRPNEAFLAGTAIKYIWRFKKKGKAVEDLQKAKWYIDRLIEEETNEQ